MGVEREKRLGIHGLPPQKQQEILQAKLAQFERQWKEAEAKRAERLQQSQQKPKG